MERREEEEAEEESCHLSWNGVCALTLPLQLTTS